MQTSVGLAIVREGVKRSRIVWAAVILALAIGVGVWRYQATRPIQVARTDVVSVFIHPVPEGPTYTFAGGNAFPPLLAIQRYIPIPLPAKSWQGPFCGNGSDVVITLADGRQFTYGPCHWPESIDRLRQAMIQYSHNP